MRTTITLMHKQFPHIPKEAIELIISINLQQLRRSIGKQSVLRARKIVLSGFGVFKVGGVKEVKKFNKLKYKIAQKCVKKKRIKERENDLNYLL